MRRMLQECAVLLGLLVCASDLDAQTVQQTGSVTGGHMTCWSTTGVIKDCGTASSPVATSIGVLASGPGICQQSGPSSGAFNRICLTATSISGGVAMTNVGGATGGFTFTLNGVTQGIATVTLPVTAGDFACFADNTGTLNDCGVTPGTFRTRLSADRTYWVNLSSVATGNCNGSTCQPGSNSNTGLSISVPFLTAQYAINTVCQGIDLNGHNVTIQLTDGNYTENLNLCPYVGRGVQGHTGPVMIQGNASTPTSVSLQPATNNAVQAVETGDLEWDFQNIKFAPATGISMLCDRGGWVAFGPGISFGATTNNHIVAESGGFCEFTADYTISGNAIVHILANSGGQIAYTGGQTVTLTGTPAFTFFADTQTGGLVNAHSVTYSGSATGQKWTRGANAIIDLNGANPDSVFPGNSNGSVSPPWAVTEGGTGLIVGTSGAIPYFNSTTTMASSALLTANQIMVGGGAGSAPASLGSLGTTTTVLHGNAGGNPSFAAVVSADLNITTTTCTNQFLTAISATGTGTCTTDVLASAQHANQGTTVTVLHGNAAGNPLFAAVSLTAEVSGVLPLANGGTNANLTASTGGIFYSTASAGAILSGTATVSLPLLSGATAAPTWATISYPTSATSGGLAYFSSATVMASSGVLASGQVLSGGGAGASPQVSPCTLGTSTSLACSSSTASNPQFVLINTTSDAGSAQFLFEKNRSAGNTLSSDNILDFQAYGFANSAQQITGRIQFIQAAASSGSNIPSKFVVNTSNASGQINLSMTLDNAGTLTIPNGVASTSKTTGTLVVTGGIGNSGAHFTDTLNIITVANAATTAALCWNSGTGLVTENGAVGTCTVSLLAAKDLIRPLSNREGFNLVMAMEPWRYTMKPDLPTWVAGEQIGFVADYADKLAIAQPVVAHNHDGSLGGFRYEQYTAALTAAFKYLKADNDNLRERVEALESRRASR